MATKVPIEIFNIAKTQVDKAEVDRWLKFLGVEGFTLPDDEVVTNPALLVAIASKRCYKSFDTKLNPNLSRIRTDWAEYLDNIMASGHGCYDEETEVLTSDGWKRWPDVTRDHHFATLDAETGDLVYRQAIAVERFRHSGRMYRVDSDQVDLLVTPNHKMYVCRTTTKGGRKREDKSYELVEAQTLGSSAHAYVKTARWNPPDPKADEVNRWGLMQPAELLLLGFAIGDGYYPGRGNVLRFRLRRDRKVKFLRDLAEKLSYDLRENGDRFSLTIHEDLVPLFADMYDECGEKQIPQRVLMTQPAHYLNFLLEGLLESDGHRGDTGDSFDTTSPNLVDQFMQLCLHVGVAANVAYTYGEEDRPSSFGTKPLTRLSVVRRATRPEVNKWVGQSGRTSWIEDWSGHVYCAQMPDNTKHVLYVRRGGRAVWCGNSVLEHSVFSFAIENVSRVFTGEMNRHRAGWAISEGSMRFIRFGEGVPYWEPESIRGEDHLHERDAILIRRIAKDLNAPILPEGMTVEQKKHATRILFEESFDNQSRIYGVLERIWKDELAPESKFADKKNITSMMRRTIGMGCATGGVWTGNVRALRHVLTMRCEPVAEEEILHVFTRVARHMKDQEPMLFGDFHMTEAGYWVPRYRKV